jgi:hypothetical protein
MKISVKSILLGGRRFLMERKLKVTNLSCNMDSFIGMERTLVQRQTANVSSSLKFRLKVNKFVSHVL